VAIEPLPLRALRLRLRFVEGRLDAHPGQFVDVRNHAGDAERLAVIGVGVGVLELECADDGSVLRSWLDGDAVPGSNLRVAGPFDGPR
jgi:NAD(P)H-flavin reductase